MKSAAGESANGNLDANIGRESIEDAADLQALAEKIHVAPLAISNDQDERQLEGAATELRRHCLSRSHEPADSTLKSPCQGTTARMPNGARVAVEYERALDVSALERRGAPDYATPHGWLSTRVLCRSGQAALSCLLHLAVSAGRGSKDVLQTHHAGRYFETKGLLDLWPDRVLARIPEAPEVDLMIAEPVHCSGVFGVSVPSALPRVRHALLLDTTLSGPNVDLAPWFARHDGAIAAVFRSGLKLDQAGLELANVGIVQLFVRADSGVDIERLSDELRHVRGLTGTGLTLDELSALSVSWFLDQDYFRHYTATIFAHNESLARTIGTDSPVFGDLCHPSLIEPAASAPFCAIRLRTGDLSSHRRLLARVDAEVERRGIIATKGGSFGFRGIRYELVEPNPADGEPFLRVAMGFRSGQSRAKMNELFAELADGRATL